HGMAQRFGGPVSINNDYSRATRAPTRTAGQRLRSRRWPYCRKLKQMPQLASTLE
ncbi:hypothetical protein CPB97_000642, partial [Podila verticillata]